MKKFFAMVLVFVVLLAFVPSNAYAFANVTDGSQAVVEEVLDINAIRVRLFNGQEAFVRLIGIEASREPNAIEFLRSRIQGQWVQLFTDPTMPNSGRWNYAYVIMGGRHINAEIILGGHGRVNTAHSFALRYHEILNGQNLARGFGVGVWAGDNQFGQIFFGDRVNINTASLHTLLNTLGLTHQQAQAIDSFRQNAVFRTVDDFKFALMATAGNASQAAANREWFTQNRGRLSVFTNINTASLVEIASLSNAMLVGNTAQNIINSRQAQPFIATSNLVTRGLITDATFATFQHFVGLINQEYVNFSIPNFRANLNTANLNQLMAAGASNAQATVIIDQRTHLPIRNLQDLIGVPNFGNAVQTLHLFDNLTARTNINTATRAEIESLFGTFFQGVDINAIMQNRPFANINQILPYMNSAVFNQISPFIYTTYPGVQNLTNINTATIEQLNALGLTTDQSQQIINQRPITQPSQLPTFLTATIRDNITLRTNINTASTFELQTLNPNITNQMISTILLYRQDQPFGSITEIQWLFSQGVQGPLSADWFHLIAPFLIVR